MRIHVRNSLLTALCAATVAVGLAACGGSHTVATAKPHRTQLVSILQSDGLLQTDPTAVLGTAKSLGVQVVRFNVLWSQFSPNATSYTKPAGFNPSDPDSPDYDWGLLDSIDRAAAAAGIKLDLTLTSPAPLWATATHPPKGISGQNWKPSPALWADFVHAVGERYSGHFTPAGDPSPLPRVSFWSLWNEPNFGPYLAPQSETATVSGSKVIVDTAAPQYRKLLNAGWRALAGTGHSTATDTILIGETAPAGASDPGIAGMTPPLQFVRDLYCVSSSYTPLRGSVASAAGCPPNGSEAAFRAANPALFTASGWATHPYDYVVPPDRPVPGSSAASANWADFARLPNLEHTLDRAAAAWGEDPAFLIYDSEFGYFTKPPASYEAEPLATVAKWINWAEYLSWKNPRIASYDQYLLDDPAANSGSKFDSGLAYASGQAKADVFAAYRLPLWLPTTSAAHATSLEVWGCARPLLGNTSLSHTIDIQFAPSGGAFHTVKQVTLMPVSRGCYFDTPVTFSRSGTVRLAYKDGTSTVTSRHQAITISH